jgi:nucleoside-diphosphate-sugar epimerase
MGKLNVLVTGSQGRIGKIIRRGLASKFDIWGIDKTLAPKNEKVFSADLSDFGQLLKTFKKVQNISGGIDTVIHLAADSRINALWDSILRNNITATRNVYECVRRFGIRKVIFTGTNHVTGGYEKYNGPVSMITAKDPVCPDSDYAVSKMFGEVLARAYWELYAIRSICLRIGSVLKNDDPTQNVRCLKTWLSHRDLVQLMRKSLKSSVNFGVYYGVSDNKGRFWDISDAQTELKYVPQDNAALRLSKNKKKGGKNDFCEKFQKYLDFAQNAYQSIM